MATLSKDLLMELPYIGAFFVFQMMEPHVYNFNIGTKYCYFIISQSTHASFTAEVKVKLFHRLRSPVIGS